MLAATLNNRTQKAGSLCILAALALTLPASAEQSTDDHIAPIEGGTYLMGTDASEVEQLRKRYNVDFKGVFENELPSHEVQLDDFQIDRFEVSNARYAEFIDANPEWHPEHVPHSGHNGDYLAHWQHGQFPEGKDQHPVVFVTWQAAQSFCHWQGGRLPTEAEWEFVARSGDEREFPWGNEPPFPLLANYSATDVDGTTAVGTFPPNDFGVYDLAGNVWEFLYDEWHPQYAGGSQVNPVAGGLLEGDEIAQVKGRRAVRGASYGGSVVNLRTRWRDSHLIDNAIGFVGFRCAYPD